MNIGKSIAILRKEAGFLQAELAARVGITQSMLCQIERGSKIPSLLLAKAIADAIGCNINAFLNEDGFERKES